MVTGHRFWRGDWQSLGHKEVGDWEALGVWTQQPGEVGLLPGCGSSRITVLLRGLLTLKVKWGCSGWTDALGLGEGPGWKCHWNHCRKRRGQVGACGS